MPNGQTEDSHLRKDRNQKQSFQHVCCTRNTVRKRSRRSRQRVFLASKSNGDSRWTYTHIHLPPPTNPGVSPAFIARARHCLAAPQTIHTVCGATGLDLPWRDLRTARCQLAAARSPHVRMLSRKRRSKTEPTRNPPEKSGRRNGIAKKRTQRANPHPTRHVDSSLLDSTLPRTAVGPGTLRLRGEDQHGEKGGGRRRGAAGGGGEREKNVMNDTVGGAIRIITKISTCGCPRAGPIARRAIHPPIHPLSPVVRWDAGADES
jgi:hypothetical protein